MAALSKESDIESLVRMLYRKISRGWWFIHANFLLSISIIKRNNTRRNEKALAPISAGHMESKRNRQRLTYADKVRNLPKLFLQTCYNIALKNKLMGNNRQQTSLFSKWVDHVDHTVRYCSGWQIVVYLNGDL